MSVVSVTNMRYARTLTHYLIWYIINVINMCCFAHYFLCKFLRFKTNCKNKWWVLHEYFCRVSNSNVYRHLCQYVSSASGVLRFMGQLSPPSLIIFFHLNQIVLGFMIPTKTMLAKLMKKRTLIYGADPCLRQDNLPQAIEVGTCSTPVQHYYLGNII